MRKGFMTAVALAAVALVVVTAAVAAVPPATGVGSNDFETDTAGWLDNGGTITKQADAYTNPGGYADGIASAAGTNHARLDRTTCVTQVGGSGPAVNCSGPFTDWGNRYNYTWNGPYTTQVDVYLDTAYANANPDTYGGNIAELSLDADPAGEPANPAKKGTRFDYTSAINSSTPVHYQGDPSNPLVGTHLRDFGFNVSTGYADDGCDGFMITGQTNVNRINANPNIGQHQPQCVDESGWYTFKHSFSEENGFLKVVMEIIPVGSATPAASWTITGIDKIEDVGCNRYGWFSNQEIAGLPIDNAKITGGCAPTPPAATLNVTKFYDADADGTQDVGEVDITGWKVSVSNGVDPAQVGTTAFAPTLAPGQWTASEFSPIEANWHATTPTSVVQTLVAGDDKSVSFGNVCTGAGGGLSTGFWTNKNGQARFGADDLAKLTSLNLRNANGSHFDPDSYAEFKTWLSKATATNMAYSLSAQLAAMKLNVFNGNVSKSALVYAPGTDSANALGFATVGELLAEANAELGLHGKTLSGSASRGYQEALKDALQQGNVNANFVQATPCAFSFAP